MEHKITLQKSSFKRKVEWDAICDYLGVSPTIEMVTLTISDINYLGIE